MPINRKNRKDAWSREDDVELFKRCKNKATLEELIEAFPNRTDKAIKDKVYRVAVCCIFLYGSQTWPLPTKDKKFF